MTVTRRLARPLLASVFVTSGIDVLRNPTPRAELAEPVVSAASSVAPVPDDAELMVKVNAGVQIGAGLLLAAGKLPRLSAVALAGSLVPTTLAGHRFWEEQDKTKRQQQQIHFLKNLGLLGGLILASVDTEGAPSLSWRAKRSIRHARKAGKRSRKGAQLAAHVGEAATAAGMLAVRAEHAAAANAPRIAARAGDLAQPVAAHAGELASQAATRAPEVAARAGELASVASNRAPEVLSRASELAQPVAARASELASVAANRAPEVISRASDLAGRASSRAHDLATSPAAAHLADRAADLATKARAIPA